VVKATIQYLKRLGESKLVLLGSRDRTKTQRLTFTYRKIGSVSGSLHMEMGVTYTAGSSFWVSNKQFKFGYEGHPGPELHPDIFQNRKEKLLDQFAFSRMNEDILSCWSKSHICSFCSFSSPPFSKAGRGSCPEKEVPLTIPKLLGTAQRSSMLFPLKNGKMSKSNLRRLIVLSLLLRQASEIPAKKVTNLASAVNGSIVHCQPSRILFD
ncbi:hypothetical protein STEG23_022032, partial [Scotinomys teguina]